MPEISQRGSQAFNSPIRHLAPFAQQAEAAGKKVYYLNIGQPDIPTPIEALEVVKNTTPPILKYSPSAGHESYRRKLVHYFKRFEVEVDYSDILITVGASEAISLVLTVCLDYGDEIILPEPFYANYLGFAHAAGIKIKPITSTIQTGFALPKIEAFEKLIGPKTKAIFLCNPNNPTGGIYSKEDLLKLAALIKKHNLFLIVDEVYREFCYDDISFYSVLRMNEIAQYTIVIDSISKKFSSCGARIGTLVSKNKEVITTILKYAQLRLSPPIMGMILGEATLDLSPTYMEEIKAEYDQRRQILIQHLKAIPHVTCYLPMGAFYAFVELPIDDSNRFCKWLLEEFSYQNQTLMLAPGIGFYATKGLGKKEVRIAYILNQKDLAKAMECLKHALSVYPGKTVPNSIDQILKKK